MKYYAGLDVSVKETAICIIDETGKICRELKVTSHPDDLASTLNNQTYSLARVGLEAGPLSQWLFSGLAEVGLPAVCIETRHAKAFEGAGEQDRSQRCPRHRPDDAGESVSTRSREDFDEPETARIADST
jgi:transposase